MDERHLNFMLAMIKGIESRDQIEAMLAAQMAAVHNATMTFARRLNNVDNIPQQDSAERTFNKLSRTFVAQVEALKRYRTGGQQKVTVEHVTVHAGGRAIVGMVQTLGEGRRRNQRINLMQLPMHRALRCQARSKRSGKRCQSPAVRGNRVCRMHGAGGGASQGNRNAWKHGGYSDRAVSLRQHIAELMRTSRAFGRDVVMSRLRLEIWIFYSASPIRSVAGWKLRARPRSLDPTANQVVEDLRLPTRLIELSPRTDRDSIGSYGDARWAKRVTAEPWTTT